MSQFPMLEDIIRGSKYIIYVSNVCVCHTKCHQYLQYTLSKKHRYCIMYIMNNLFKNDIIINQFLYLHVYTMFLFYKT